MFTQEEKQFLNKNSAILKRINRKIVKDIRRDAVVLKRGDERDDLLDAANKLDDKLGSYFGEDEKNDKDPFPGV